MRYDPFPNYTPFVLTWRSSSSVRPSSLHVSRVLAMLCNLVDGMKRDKSVLVSRFVYCRKFMIHKSRHQPNFFISRSRVVFGVANCRKTVNTQNFNCSRSNFIHFMLVSLKPPKLLPNSHFLRRLQKWRLQNIKFRWCSTLRDFVASRSMQWIRKSVNDENNDLSDFSMQLSQFNVIRYFPQKKKNPQHRSLLHPQHSTLHRPSTMLHVATIIVVLQHETLKLAQSWIIFEVDVAESNAIEIESQFFVACWERQTQNSIVPWN